MLVGFQLVPEERWQFGHPKLVDMRAEFDAVDEFECETNALAVRGSDLKPGKKVCNVVFSFHFNLVWASELNERA